MIYKIKRGESIVASVHANGAQTRQVMGVDIVDMSFTLNNAVIFKIGDSCEVFGQKYIINILPELKKINEREYSYSVQLEHQFYSLQDTLYLMRDADNNYTQGGVIITGTLFDFLSLWIENANRVQNGWSLGTIEVTTQKTIEFKNENLLQILTRLSVEFDLEYLFTGSVLNFFKQTGDMGVTLSYGKDNGLLSLGRQNKENVSIFTRLFVKGGSRNILPMAYRNGSTELRMPVGQGDFIEDASLISQYGVKEEYVVFPDIFPNRIGTVTAVDSSDPFVFFDTSLDFDITQQLLPGIEAKISFLSGDLTGYEILFTYVHATNKFTLSSVEDEKNIEIPSANYKPKVADQYVLLDIIMPQSYVTAAEIQLHSKALEYYAVGSDISYNDKFIIDCDPLYFKQKNIEPILGYNLSILETNPFINVSKRIETIKRDLQNVWKYELDLTDKIGASDLAKRYSDDQKIKKLIFTFSQPSSTTTQDQFLRGLTESGGYILSNGVRIKAGYSDFANYAADSDKWDGHYFPGYLDQPVRKEDSPFFNGVSSQHFASGFAGHGYRISKDVNGNYIIEIDRAVIRKDFTVYELIASQVRAVNGSLAVTDSIKIKSVVQDGESYVCTIDTADNTMYTPFRVDDNILCQVFNGYNVKYYRGLVTATTSDSFTVTIYEGDSVPEVGDAVVRWGNNTDISRQGMIYMTTTDVDSPFQDVRDGITQSNPNGNLKVRLGKLDGVTSPTWGALNGYGLFGQNVYLENGSFSGRLTIKGTGSNVYTKDETDEQIDTVAATWELIPVSDKQVHAFNYDVTGTLNTLVYSVKFMRAGKDVTAIMQQSGLNLYNFERKNTYGFDDNNVSDASWNAAHIGAKTVTLTDKDIYAVGTLEVVYDETILETEYKRLTNGN